jgi:hypothetical protein
MADLEMITPPTKLIRRNELHIGLKKCANDLILFISSQSKTFASDMLPVGIPDGVQLINYLAHKNEWLDIYRKLFLQCFFKSETKRPGSGIFAAYFMAKMLDGSRINSLDELSKHCKITTKNNAMKMIGAYLDPNITELFQTIFSATGTAGKIKIKSGSGTAPILELISGHKFKIGIHQDFCAEKIEFRYARILLVDGKINSVSEIDNLLTELHEKEEPCIFIARGFEKDIISTLNMNFKRNTLQVIPVVVPDKVENINMFSDICTTSGSRLISAESGERTSSKTLHDLATVLNFQCDVNSIQFQSKEELTNAINRKIARIESKIEKSLFDEKMTNEDVSMVYRNRIDSLCSNSATLWLPIQPNQKNIELYISSRLKFALDLLDGFCRSGSMHISHIIKDHDLSKSLPANIAVTAVKTASSSIESITNAGGCLAIQRN